MYLRSKTIASEQFSDYHLNLRIVTKPVALPTLLKQALPEAVNFIEGRLLIYLKKKVQFITLNLFKSNLIVFVFPFNKTGIVMSHLLSKLV